MKTSSVNSPAPLAASNLIAAIAKLYTEIEAHATEYAERRAELLEMQAEAHSAGRPVYPPHEKELEKVSAVIRSDEQQELLLVALANGFIRPVLGQG